MKPGDLVKMDPFSSKYRSIFPSFINEDNLLVVLKIGLNGTYQVIHPQTGTKITCFGDEIIPVDFL